MIFGLPASLFSSTLLASDDDIGGLGGCTLLPCALWIVYLIWMYWFPKCPSATPSYSPVEEASVNVKGGLSLLPSAKFTRRLKKALKICKQAFIYIRLGIFRSYVYFA